MRYLILLLTISLTSLSLAQPLDDVHLTGTVRGYFGPDTTVLSGATVKIIDLPSGHRDSVLTDTAGHWSWTGVINPAGNGNPALPTEMTLSPNYPNPFSGTTTVKFENNSQQNVKLYVYNILGQRVADLVDRNLRPGGYNLQWNGMTKDGARLAHGIYFLCLNANGKVLTRKIVMLGNGSSSGGITLRESSSAPGGVSRPITDGAGSLDDFVLQLEFHRTGYDSVVTNVTLPDGRDSAMVTSLHRLNTAPTVSAVWITSLDSTDTAPLTGHATGQDANQDLLFWIYDWQVRGQWLNLNIATLNDSLFMGQDTVRFRARPADAEAQGSWAESDPIVVRNGVTDMVLVPEGPFSMGSTGATQNATPLHVVTLPAFYMDIYEVTNVQYKLFCDSTVRAYPADPGFNGMPNYFTNATYANRPVVNVTWQDAKDYAVWAGKRLPTEAEWERAARGNTDNRQYPWGNTWNAANANSNGNDNFTNTSTVGAFPAGISPAGCYDMAGNVWEWCEDDWHEGYSGAPTNGSAWIDNPRGASRCIRGGSWGSGSGSLLCEFREFGAPGNITNRKGFRCARNVANQPPQVPSSPAPPNNGTNQFVDVNLFWTCNDQDWDTLTFDVSFGLTPTPPTVSSGLTSATYDPGTLADSTTYYWQIAAHDNHGHTTTGPIWTFTTSSGEITQNMVLVPSGSYFMGTTWSAQPMHNVLLQAFYMDAYEVTNAQYKAFCDSTTRPYPADPGFAGIPNYFTNPLYAAYPVVKVSWNDARAYAAWLGKRLPTESEWERAAKGAADNREWPWGNTWVNANANITGNPADSFSYTSPVGRYPNGISTCGCFDMAGNVAEWCEDDWHTTYNGAPTDGSAWLSSPRGTDRMIRSGSWAGLSPVARCANRQNLAAINSNNTTGFRCAVSAANRPPQIPSLQAPANHSTNQSIQINLAWTSGDVDLDPLTYDVYLGSAAVPPLVVSGLTTASFDPGPLNFSTTYLWRIVARDIRGNETASPVWSFTTINSGVPAGMVLVPAGPYSMGATYQNQALPVHIVTVPAYYIDIYEVTNAQYKAFCDSTGHNYPDDPNFGMTNYATNPLYANYPAVMISWYEARAFAEWAGKRLPTEAEWERAAKGNLDNRQWPWGDTWIGANANIANNPADGYEYTAPVGTYPNGISMAGCYEMSGNVEEWCEDDWHTNYTGAPTDGSAWVDTPRAAERIFRRGSFPHDNLVARCARRGALTPESFFNNVGFRCAMTP